MYDKYENIEEYNPNHEGKKLIVFDGMITDMLNNPIVTELLIRGKNLNAFIAFITQSFLLNIKILD